eukprot:Gb_41475 [translate_table: standard]
MIADCNKRRARRPGLDEVQQSVSIVDVGRVEEGSDKFGKNTNCANHNSPRNATQMGSLCSPLHFNPRSHSPPLNPLSPSSYGVSEIIDSAACEVLLRSIERFQ